MWEVRQATQNPEDRIGLCALKATIQLAIIKGPQREVGSGAQLERSSCNLLVFSRAHRISGREARGNRMWDRGKLVGIE
jgi:hypothetical protein